MTSPARQLPTFNSGDLTDVQVRSVAGPLLHVEVSGVPAILPGTLAVPPWLPVPQLHRFVGRKLRVRVAAVRADGVSVSRRDVIVREYQDATARSWQHVRVGETVDARVTNVTDWGAYAVFDGVVGFIAAENLSWQHVIAPEREVRVGDPVTATVLAKDDDRHIASLGVKQLTADPLRLFARRHRIGDRLAGVITTVVTFGAFVEIDDGVQALVHVSDLSEAVEHPRDLVRRGDHVTVRLTELDLQRRQVHASMRPAEDR